MKDVASGRGDNLRGLALTTKRGATTCGITGGGGGLEGEESYGVPLEVTTEKGPEETA